MLFRSHTFRENTCLFSLKYRSAFWHYESKSHDFRKRPTDKKNSLGIKKSATWWAFIKIWFWIRKHPLRSLESSVSTCFAGYFLCFPSARLDNLQNNRPWQNPLKWRHTHNNVRLHFSNISALLTWNFSSSSKAQSNATSPLSKRESIQKLKNEINSEITDKNRNLETGSKNVPEERTQNRIQVTIQLCKEMREHYEEIWANK